MNYKQTINTLLNNIKEATDPNDCMKYAQAALNVAHVEQIRRDAPQTNEEREEARLISEKERDARKAERAEINKARGWDDQSLNELLKAIEAKREQGQYADIDWLNKK